MTEYEIFIEWIDVGYDGCWSWSVHNEIRAVWSGSSYWRWTGLLAAKRAARKHAHGVPRFKDTSKAIKYTVWD